MWGVVRVVHLLWVIMLCLATTNRAFSLTDCKDKFPVNWINGNGAVRFSHQPEDSNYLHAPLVFRAVDDRDVRLGTAPATVFGRTVYISKQEMHQLLEKISELPMSWCISEKVKDFEPSWKLNYHWEMDVKIIFAAGTAESQIDPDRICDTLTSLDPAIKTNRALWEFQFFRIGNHCTVPHFNPRAYPDRLP